MPYFIFSSLFAGIHIALAIMVSPDVGQRNHSVELQSEVPVTQQNEPILTEKSERIRRLIPYMTFYVPPNFPVAEFYNLNPIVSIPFHLTQSHILRNSSIIFISALFNHAYASPNIH